MNDQSKAPNLLKRSRIRRTYTTLSIGPLLLAMLLVALVLCAPNNQNVSKFIELGLLHPIVAALLAFAIVMGVRLTKGRYVNERRKGMSSASNATLAIRFWAICFVLLVGAMLLSVLIARPPADILMQEHNSVGQIGSEAEIPPGSQTPATMTTPGT